MVVSDIIFFLDQLRENILKKFRIYYDKRDFDTLISLTISIYLWLKFLFKL